MSSACVSTSLLLVPLLLLSLLFSPTGSASNLVPTRLTHMPVAPLALLCTLCTLAAAATYPALGAAGGWVWRRVLGGSGRYFKLLAWSHTFEAASQV
jgi:hypothetical protein